MRDRVRRIGGVGAIRTCAVCAQRLPTSSPSVVEARNDTVRSADIAHPARSARVVRVAVTYLTSSYYSDDPAWHEPRLRDEVQSKRHVRSHFDEDTPNMKNLPARIASVMTLAFAVTAQATAAQTATAMASFEVEAVDVIGVSGDPGKLTVVAPAAGEAAADAVDASTTWAVSTNGSNRKVTGEIDTAMPTDVTLSVQLAAPTGGTSAGSLALSIAAVDLVTGITTLEESGLAVTYTLSAEATAGAVTETARQVTYTVLEGA